MTQKSFTFTDQEKAYYAEQARKQGSIKRIVMEVIPNKEQRYETVGDYWLDKDGALQIRCSDLGDNRYEHLVFIHELWEVLRTRHDGINEPDIMEFDKHFEAMRQEGNLDEPGDDPYAPYKKQHCEATGIERILCALLNVDWKDYEKACNDAGKP